MRYAYGIFQDRMLVASVDARRFMMRYVRLATMGVSPRYFPDSAPVTQLPAGLLIPPSTSMARSTFSRAAISFLVSPIRDYAFFKKPVLQHLFGKGFLKIARFGAERLYLDAGGLTRRIARQALLARFKEFLRPTVIQALGYAFPAAQGGDAFLTAQARSRRCGFSLPQNSACVSCAGCLEPPFQPGLSCSWISASSSFPSVTTMNQKSSLMKTPQYVP